MGAGDLMKVGMLFVLFALVFGLLFAGCCCCASSGDYDYEDEWAEDYGAASGSVDTSSIASAECAGGLC
ncbi:hypothetical protein DRN67_01615 [Candidatus Micrarchaeota archaeon]|nr:MAG: hypothetical protein DRN67_01615 [Candidatus Micrarchaeota archaeon]